MLGNGPGIGSENVDYDNFPGVGTRTGEVLAGISNFRVGPAGGSGSGYCMQVLA